MLGSGFVFLVILLQNLDPLSAVRIHCQNIERMHEENIHHCCKHPDGHNDVTESCALKTNFRLPSADEEALEDVTVNQVMSGTCWAKCVVDHYNLLENNTLDMGKIRSYYKRYHTIDPEYEAEMVNAYEKCHSKSETALEQFLAMPLVTEFIKTKMCKPTSSIILSCVIYNFFHNCPRSRWAHTSECEETLAFTKKCKDAFTTM